VRVLIRDVEVEGNRVDVLIRDDRVAQVTPYGASPPSQEHDVIEGAGGALLPGLHDHHVHLLATAAARASVDCGTSLAPLRLASGSAENGWIRGVNYHESVAGNLDRHLLDAVVPDRPVRIQHRSGALWILNSAALALVSLDSSPDVERDAQGRPNGRLWRYDSRLRLPSVLDVPSLGRELTSYGITSVTDATPDVDAQAHALLAQLPQAVTFLAGRKLLLRDHDLPTYDELSKAVSERHDRGEPVAVHCVTAESLILTLAVLDEVGRMPGDRIEHGAIVPEAAQLRGLRVVTQPAFVSYRGDDYARDVDPRDLPHLYPFASLLAAGIDVVASSDAPYGPLDPWTVIRSARDRTTQAGLVLGPGERVPAATALAGYLTDTDGRARRVRPGAPADLLLLHTGLAEALRAPDFRVVRETFHRRPIRPD
jgi:predicted amidohydrolase YtcJ